MRVLISICAISVVIPFASLGAQQSALPGDRVRVSECHIRTLRSGTLRNECERHVGTLSVLTAQVVTLRMEGTATEFAVPLDSVIKLEVHRGRRARTGRGALIGSIVGVASGAIVGVAVAKGPSTCEDLGWPEPCGARLALTGGLLFGASGALVGTVIGALIKTDRWEEVPLDRLSVGLAPQRDGRFALAMSVSF
jgi:hypothetical protein